METRRTQRVSDTLQQEIAGILQKNIKDPRIGFITVTGVDVSADLRVAQVFYTVLGGEASREDTERGLRSAAPFIRRELGRHLRLKAVPELRFRYDESTDRGFRMEKLLEGLRHDPEEPHH